jgi:hypothetical protein
MDSSEDGGNFDVTTKLDGLNPQKKNLTPLEY